MPVDKCGQMQRADAVYGVSLSYIANHFLRRNGTNTATGSINMTGNTLTNISEPVNAQDAAIKHYADNIVGGADKVSKSGDTMTGNLNMGGCNNQPLIGSTNNRWPSSHKRLC